MSRRAAPHVASRRAGPARRALRPRACRRLATWDVLLRSLCTWESPAPRSRLRCCGASTSRGVTSRHEGHLRRSGRAADRAPCTSLVSWRPSGSVRTIVHLASSLWPVMSPSPEGTAAPCECCAVHLGARAWVVTMPRAAAEVSTRSDGEGSGVHSGMLSLLLHAAPPVAARTRVTAAMDRAD